MKRILSAVLCLVLLCCCFASCSSLKEDEKGAVISAYLSQFPDTLDPALVQLNDETSQILGLIFESLTTVDASGNVVGALATKWYGKYDKLDDEYRMYFELKDTAWSDTIKVQAQHVVDAWARILDPATESPYASMLFPIKNARNVKAGIMTRDDLGIAAEDEDLLCVTFEEEFDINLFAEIVSSIHLCPQREDIIQRSEKENADWSANAATIVCNGPFRVQAIEEGDKLSLERNSYYMRNVEDDPLDKTVLPYRIVCIYQEKTLEDVRNVDEAARLTQMQYQVKRWNDGNIFYFGDFDKETYATFADKLTVKPVLSSCAIYFNCAVIDDAAVRNALSKAIDRQAIVSALGTGEKVAEGIVPAGVFATGRGTSYRGTSTALYTAQADKAGAEALLSGKKKNDITLAYLVPESSALIGKYARKVNYANEYKTIAEACKSNWEALGFKVELRALNTAEYRTALYTRDYDAIIANIVGDSTDAFGYLAPYAKYYSGAAVSTDEGANEFSLHYTNYDNAEYEAAIDKIVCCSNRTERAELCRAAETILGNDCPVTSLFTYSYSYTTTSALKGVSSNYFGFVNFNRLALDNWRVINAAEDAASAAAESEKAAN